MSIIMMTGLARADDPTFNGELNVIRCKFDTGVSCKNGGFCSRFFQNNPNVVLDMSKRQLQIDGTGSPPVEPEDLHAADPVIDKPLWVSFTTANVGGKVTFYWLDVFPDSNRGSSFRWKMFLTVRFEKKLAERQTFSPDHVGMIEAERTRSQSFNGTALCALGCSRPSA